MHLQTLCDNIKTIKVMIFNHSLVKIRYKKLSNFMEFQSVLQEKMK